MKSEPNIEKIVYFVRHGQSEDNIAPVFQAPDSPLSEVGKEQAKSIADRVSKLSFEALLSSPFMRARQTAEAIAQATGKKPEYSELFGEAKKPIDLNSKSVDDPKAGEIWRAWQRSLYTPGVRAEDGENFDDLLARVDQALSYLKEREEKSLVVVTHGFFLRTLVGRVLLGKFLSGDILRKFVSGSSTENTGLTVLRYNVRFGEGSDWRLWIYNDHAHLAE